MSEEKEEEEPYNKWGAGVLPYSVHNGDVWILFHETFKGKKVGTLVDFGGAMEEGEDAKQTAAREFSEETLGCYMFGRSSIPGLITKSTERLKDILANQNYGDLEALNRIFDGDDRPRRVMWLRAKDVLQMKTDKPLFVRLSLVAQQLNEAIVQIYSTEKISLEEK